MAPVWWHQLYGNAQVFLECRFWAKTNFSLHELPGSGTDPVDITQQKVKTTRSTWEDPVLYFGVVYVSVCGVSVTLISIFNRVQ